MQRENHRWWILAIKALGIAGEHRLKRMQQHHIPENKGNQTAVSICRHKDGKPYEICLPFKWELSLQVPYPVLGTALPKGRTQLESRITSISMVWKNQTNPNSGYTGNKQRVSIHPWWTWGALRCHKMCGVDLRTFQKDQSGTDCSKAPSSCQLWMFLRTGLTNEHWELIKVNPDLHRRQHG